MLEELPSRHIANSLIPRLIHELGNHIMVAENFESFDAESASALSESIARIRACQILLQVCWNVVESRSSTQLVVRIGDPSHFAAKFMRMSGPRIFDIKIPAKPEGADDERYVAALLLALYLVLGTTKTAGTWSYVIQCQVEGDRLQSDILASRVLDLADERAQMLRSQLEEWLQPLLLGLGQPGYKAEVALVGQNAVRVRFDLPARFEWGALV